MSFRYLLRVCVCVLTLGLTRTAPADFVVNVSPSSPFVGWGESGYFLDFSLTTTTAIDLGGFNVTVTVPTASGITFTGGTSSVPNYVFASDPSGLFLFGNPFGPNSGDISDFPNALNAPLAPGTFGLGRMFFSVASNAPLATVNITLDVATSFTQGVSPFGAYSYTPPGGSTVATVRVVPEPSSMLLGTVYAATGGSIWLRKRRRGRRVVT